MRVMKLALVVFAALSALAAYSQQGGNLSRQSRDALIAVLDEERLAKHAYEVVLRTYPDLMPFKNLVLAEANHEQAVIRVMRSYGVPIPANRWGVTSFVPTPATIDDAYLLGKRIEEEDIAMLQRYLRQVREPGVQKLFTNLLQASRNHLAAILRAMSGDCMGGGGMFRRGGNGNGGGQCDGTGQRNGQGNGNGNCNGNGNGNGGGPRRP